MFNNHTLAVHYRLINFCKLGKKNFSLIGNYELKHKRLITNYRLEKKGYKINFLIKHYLFLKKSKK